MKKKKIIRKEIYIVAIFFVALFGVMIAYFVQFVSKDSKEFIYNQYNSRLSVFSDDVVRGNIVTSDAHIIATTKKDSEGNEYRYYPYERLFAHAVGYSGQGLTGLEAKYNFDLLKSHINIEDVIDNSLNGKKSQGDTLVTTLNYDAQLAAFDGLGLYDGAVIAIEPDTGKVICMVSKPDFDPNSIAENWDEMVSESSNSSVLLNRATQGAYPPGSTFKIVTTIAYLRDNDGDPGFSYNCNGAFGVEDYTIHCSNNKNHGSENLQDAFSNSCNSAFASIGVTMGRETFVDTAEDLLFNDELPTNLDDTKTPLFKLTNSTSDTIVAQTAIGQGDTTVSPLYMCMLVSAIANDGVLMEPYIVDSMKSDDGNEVFSNSSSEYGQIMTKSEATILQQYMQAVVMDGTADSVDFGDLTVYGKTGTAEYTEDKNLTHSWFVGYACDDYGNDLAIAVIMEGAGYGSKFAAPLAAKVFDAYFN